MILHYAPGACSLSPHIVAKEAGIPVELSKLDFATKLTADGRDFKSLNPKGYVPTLEIDDKEVLTEGVAIVQYLADQKPETKLAPAAGSMERYRLIEWLNFISTELHKNFGVFFGQNVPEESKAAAAEKLKTRFEYVNSQLEGKQFLLGDTFTVADAYCFTILRWNSPKTANIDLEQLPNLKAYMERVSARPAVQEALKEEGLA